jgi:hypothetical protein
LGSRTQLTLTHDVSILGQSARATSLQADGSARVLTVDPGVEAELYGVTVSDGDANSASGGNILNQGSLIVSPTA